MTGETMTSEDDLTSTHRGARNNKQSIESGGTCGCFYCLNTFQPSRIEKWIDNGVTALCPICGVDAVLSSNVSSVDPSFLRRMHDRWFGQSKKFDAAEWQRAVDKDRWPLPDKS